VERGEVVDGDEEKYRRAEGAASRAFRGLVQVRAKNPPSMGRGMSPSLEIIWRASAFTDNEMDTWPPVCTPFRLPVPRLSRDAVPMDGPDAFIDRNTPALLGRLRRLVGIATVNPPGENYEAVTGYLTRELGRVGLSASRYPIPGPSFGARFPRPSTATRATT
jgi:hypothetical protein